MSELPENKDPIDREAWRKLLAEQHAAVPPEIDARIRAEARQALATTPRQRRWLLPVSLAASVLVAVLLSTQMSEQTEPTAVTESDIAIVSDADRQAASGGVAQDFADESSGVVADAPAEAIVSARGAAPPPASAPAALPPPARGPEAAPAAAKAAIAEPMLQRGSRAERTANQAVAADEMLRSFAEADAEKTPQEWLADIARLRAAGRDEDADSELARFDAAYPGWWQQTGETRP